MLPGLREALTKHFTKTGHSGQKCNNSLPYTKHTKSRPRWGQGKEEVQQDARGTQGGQRLQHTSRIPSGTPTWER